MLDSRNLSTNSRFNLEMSLVNTNHNLNTLATNLSSNNLSLNIHLSVDRVLLNRVYSLEEENRFLLDCFVSQRKVYRYYKAYSELEADEIGQNKFDKIENSCVLTLKKDKKQKLLHKIELLYVKLQNSYPEELEYMSDDDLADILQVSKINLKHALEDLKIASK